MVKIKKLKEALRWWNEINEFVNTIAGVQSTDEKEPSNNQRWGAIVITARYRIQIVLHLVPLYK